MGIVCSSTGFPEFVKRYKEELAAPATAAHPKRLKDLTGKQTVTLLYATRKGRFNGATVIFDMLR